MGGLRVGHDHGRGLARAVEPGGSCTGVDSPEASQIESWRICRRAVQH